jgi:hypothetical protein
MLIEAQATVVRTLDAWQGAAGLHGSAHFANASNGLSPRGRWRPYSIFTNTAMW